MEYHNDRFVDHSLLIHDDRNRLLAVLPAYQKDKVFASHQGLTYGGIITAETMKVPLMLQIANHVFETVLYIDHMMEVFKIIFNVDLKLALKQF